MVGGVQPTGEQDNNSRPTVLWLNRCRLWAGRCQPTDAGWWRLADSIGGPQGTANTEHTSAKSPPVRPVAISATHGGGRSSVADATCWTTGAAKLRTAVGEEGARGVQGSAVNWFNCTQTRTLRVP